MLKMTIRLNRKYFGSHIDGDLDKPGKIWCETLPPRYSKARITPQKSAELILLILHDFLLVYF